MSFVRLRTHRGPLVATFRSLDDAPVLIRGFTFQPTGPEQIAIDLTWPKAESCINTTVIIEDCTFIPLGYHWGLACIRLTNAWNALIRGCNFIGPSGMPEPLTGHGFILDGQTTGATVRDCRGSGLGAFGYIKGECEGSRVLDNDAIGCRYGLVAWTDSGGAEPGLWAIGNHFNTTVAGIDCRRRYQVTMRDNLLYAGDYFEGTKGQAYVGMKFDTCQEVYVDNCKVSRSADAHDKPIIPWMATQCQAVEGMAEMARW